MSEITTFVGLDVHKETITIAAAVGDSEPKVWRTVANRLDKVKMVVEHWGTNATEYTYEAGPCGFVLYRQLTALGAKCVIAAPSRIPKEPGERVKTDRRDALKLVRLLRRGDLKEVWAPSPEYEALRDLSRARRSAKQDLQRARNQTTKFLLRLGLEAPGAVKNWTKAYWSWLRGLELDQPLQQLVLDDRIRTLDQREARVKHLEELLKTAAVSETVAPLFKAFLTMRGIGPITAIALIAELGDIRRFKSPRQLMAYIGLVCSEYSSGGRSRRGPITKAGNSHLRHVLIEMAWHAAQPVRVGKKLAAQRRGQPKEIVALAERSDVRLNRRYHRLIHRGKLSKVAATAVAREAVGFIWAIACIQAGVPVHPPREQHARPLAA